MKTSTKRKEKITIFAPSHNFPLKARGKRVVTPAMETCCNARIGNVLRCQKTKQTEKQTTSTLREVQDQYLSFFVPARSAEKILKCLHKQANKEKTIKQTRKQKNKQKKNTDNNKQ